MRLNRWRSVIQCHQHFQKDYISAAAGFTLMAQFNNLESFKHGILNWAAMDLPTRFKVFNIASV